MLETLPLLFSFLVGVVSSIAASYTYDVYKNRALERKSSSKILCRDYKLYWYNTRSIKNSAETNVIQATVKIACDKLLRVTVDITQDELEGQNSDHYKYEGFMRTTDTQLHWTMYGVSHAETFYAIFDRNLGKNIGVIQGLFLLTSNNEAKKPIAIRCVLSCEELHPDQARSLLGGKDFLTVKTKASLSQSAPHDSGNTPPWLPASEGAPGVEV
jgi:hypothetical protein